MKAPGYVVNLRERTDLALKTAKQKAEDKFPNKILAIIQKNEKEIINRANSGKSKFILYIMKKHDPLPNTPSYDRLNEYVKQRFGNSVKFDSKFKQFNSCSPDFNYKRVLYLKW